MKIARFQHNGHTAHGVVEGDEVVEIEGDIFSEFTASGERRKLADVKLLAPTDPKEIWAPGLNFANHLEFAAGVLGDEDPHIPEHPETVDQGPELPGRHRREHRPAPRHHRRSPLRG